MGNGKRYYVLVADIKKSKKYPIEARGRLQSLLAASLAYLNGLYSYGLEKRVVFSGGDEIQGLFRDPVTPFLYYRMLSFILGPRTIRGGIGAGDWSIRIEGESSPSQDGSAYHHARQALDEAKSNRPYDAVFAGSSRGDGLLTVLMDHPLGLSEMRTSAQNDTALVVEMMFPLTFGFAYQESLLEHDRGHIRESSLFMLSSRESPAGKGRAKPGLIQGIMQSSGLFDSLPFQPVDMQTYVLHKHTPWFTDGKDIQGIAAKLSNFSGMTRQGIDRQLASSRVVQERNAVIALAYGFEKALEVR